MSPSSTVQPRVADWKPIVARYQRPTMWRSLLQVATTLLPLAAAFFVLYRSLVLPYWVTLLLAVPTAGLLVRTFIIMHDCAHGSFLSSKRWNSVIGWI